jgi:hypothetical protein
MADHIGGMDDHTAVLHTSEEVSNCLGAETTTIPLIPINFHSSLILASSRIFLVMLSISLHVILESQKKGKLH